MVVAALGKGNHHHRVPGQESPHAADSELFGAQCATVFPLPCCRGVREVEAQQAARERAAATISPPPLAKDVLLKPNPTLAVNAIDGGGRGGDGGGRRGSGLRKGLNYSTTRSTKDVTETLLPPGYGLRPQCFVPDLRVPPWPTCVSIIPLPPSTPPRPNSPGLVPLLAASSHRLIPRPPVSSGLPSAWFHTRVLLVL